MAATKWAQLPPAVRFWSKVDQGEGCWEWSGTRNHKGYGTFHVGGKNTPAHRFAYEDRVGPIPPGLQLDHLCRNHGCVNPTHLEPVTNRENLIRGIGFPGQNVRKRTCPRGHPYDATRSDGSRFCRQCRRLEMQANYRRYPERLKAAARDRYWARRLAALEAE